MRSRSHQDASEYKKCTAPRECQAVPLEAPIANVSSYRFAPQLGARRSCNKCILHKFGVNFRREKKSFAAMQSFAVLSVVLAVSCVGTMAAPQIFQGGQLPNPFQSFLNLIPFRPFQAQQDPTGAVAVPAAPVQYPQLQNPFAQFFQLQAPANGWLQFPNLFPNLFPSGQRPIAPVPVPAEGPTIIIVSRPPAAQQPAAAASPAAAQEAAPAPEPETSDDDVEGPGTVADQPNQAAAAAAAPAAATSSAGASAPPAAGK